jgi:hypothetical protein
MDILGTAFPSNFAKKEDFPQPRLMTIASVMLEDISMDDHPAEMKAVMHFAEADIKPCIVNKTNATVLAAQIGPDTDSWINRQIVVFNDMTVVFQGKAGGIRMKVQEPQPVAGIVAASPSGAMQTPPGQPVPGSQPVVFPGERIPGFDDDVPV